jgi:hypothetical protein
VTSWLRALVDPHAVARPVYFSADLASPPALLAILVTGNIERFANVAARRGLPLPDYLNLYASDAGVSGKSDPDYSLATADANILLGALEFVVGRPAEAVSKLASSSTFRPTESVDDLEQEKLACAAIISALALTDSGNRSAAVALLERQLSWLTHEYSRWTTTLHLAALSVDSEDVGEASKAYDLWQELLASSISSDVNPPIGAIDFDKLLTAVAVRGVEHYNARRRQYIMHEDGTEFAARRIVGALENDNMTALGYRLIDDEFATTSQSVRTITFTFGESYDATEDTLAKALLRARFLADPIAVRKIRATLAHYQMTRVYGSRQADPAVSALHTLLAARDSRGVERAVQRLRSSGPSIALRHVAIELIQRITSSPLSRVDGITSSTIPIFRSASDMLSAEEADDLLLVVIGLLSNRSGESANMPDMDLIRLTADLAPSASKNMQDKLVDLLISGSRERADDTFYESLADKIRWRDVMPSQILATFDWVERALAVNSPVLSARSALQRLASIDPVKALDVARLTLESHSSTHTAVLLWNVGIQSELNSSDIETIESIALRDLASIRTRARNNVHDIPSRLHSTDLLVRIARTTHKESIWQELIEFSLDASLAAHDRARSARSLIEAGSLLPAHLIASIAERMSSTLVTDHVEEMLTPGSDQYPSVTELALAYVVGVVPEQILEAKLIEFSGGQNARRRYEVAETLASLAYPDVRPFSPLIPLCIALSQDSVTEVRAVSLHTTARLLAYESDPTIKATMVSLLIDGIRDPGIRPVAYTLQGLATTDTAGLVDELREAVVASRNHPSKQIREFASRIIGSED